MATKKSYIVITQSIQNLTATCALMAMSEKIAEDEVPGAFLNVRNRKM